MKASEHALLDTPVAITSFISEATNPRLPSLAVAAGSHIFIYRNLRPYYKFVLPPENVNTEEQDIWWVFCNYWMAIITVWLAVSICCPCQSLLRALWHSPSVDSQPRWCKVNTNAYKALWLARDSSIIVVFCIVSFPSSRCFWHSSLRRYFCGC